MFLHSQPQNVTFFGNRVLAEIIKIRTEMKSYWIRVSPKSNDWYPYERLKGTQRDTEMKAM